MMFIGQFTRASSAVSLHQHTLLGLSGKASPAYPKKCSLYKGVPLGEDICRAISIRPTQTMQILTKEWIFGSLAVMVEIPI